MKWKLICSCRYLLSHCPLSLLVRETNEMETYSVWWRWDAQAVQASPYSLGKLMKWKRDYNQSYIDQCEYVPTR